MTYLEQISDQLISLPQLTHLVGNRYRLDAAVRRGAYRRVMRGYYMRSRDWEQLGEKDRYLALVLALAADNPEIIFCQQTALLLHGLPLEELPQKVQAYLPYRSRMQELETHHGSLHLPTETTVFLPGVRLTSLERTLEDLALAAAERDLGLVSF